MMLSSQKTEKQEGMSPGRDILGPAGSGCSSPGFVCCQSRLKDQCEIYGGQNDLKRQSEAQPA